MKLKRLKNSILELVFWIKLTFNLRSDLYIRKVFMQKKFWWTALMTPLVIAPIAIVASCGSGTSSNNDLNNKPNNDANSGSNDKPNNDSSNDSNDKPNDDSNSDFLYRTFRLWNNLMILGSLTEEQKEITQYVDDKAKLIKLILEKKDQIFWSNGTYDLTDEKQIEIIGDVQAYIDGDIKQNVRSGCLLFTIKVRASADPNSFVLINEEKIELGGFGGFGLNDSYSELVSKSLTEEQKETSQYVNDEAKLIKLILEKKDQIFWSNGYYNLTDERQIEIIGGVNALKSGLSFRIRVKASDDPNAPVLINEKEITLEGFGKFTLKNGDLGLYTLESLTEEQKEPTQYVKNKAELIKLILENKDQIFDYPPVDLENRIEIEDVSPDIKRGWLSFWIKIETLGKRRISLSGFGKFKLKNSYSITLESLTHEQKEISQYNYWTQQKLLPKLILEKKDQIFDYPPVDLDKKRIETLFKEQDIENGSFSFGIKVKDGPYRDSPVLIDNDEIYLKGFAKFRIKKYDKGIELLLTEKQKEIQQYVKDHSKLARLILEKQDQIFETDYYNLTDEWQIKIRFVSAHKPYRGFLNFSIGLEYGSSPYTSNILLFERELTLSGFSKN